MASTNLRRKDIRNGVVSRLTGQTVAEDRVYPARVDAIPDEKLPAIGVYTNDENCTDRSMTSPVVDADLVLEVQCVVSVNDEYADNLDDLIDDCRDTLLTDGAWLGQFPHGVKLTGVRVAYSNDGGKRRAFGVLSLRLGHVLTFTPTANYYLETVHTQVTAPGTGASGPVIAETEIDLTE